MSQAIIVQPGSSSPSSSERTALLTGEGKMSYTEATDEGPTARYPENKRTNQLSLEVSIS